MGGLKSVSYRNGDTVIKENYTTDSSLVAREIYLNGHLNSSSHFTNSKLTSHTRFISGRRHEVINYHENGQVYARGFCDDTIKYGWWTYYKDGKEDKKIEYIPLCNGTYYVNQLKYLDSSRNGNQRGQEIFVDLKITNVGGSYQIDYFI